MTQIALNFQLFALVVTAILHFSVGCYIFGRNRTDFTHRVFLALAISLAVWCLTIFFDIYYNNNVIMYDFFDRLVYVPGFFIAIFFYLFSYSYPYKSSQILKIATLIYLGFVLLFSYVIFSPLFATQAELLEGNAVSSHNALTFIMYSIVVTLPFILGIARLYKKMTEGDGVYRKYFPFLISMMTVAILISLFFDLYLPGINNNSYIVVGPISSLLFLYAVMRLVVSKE